MAVYSWGVVAYEVLTGTHPFAGKTTPQQLIVAHMTEPPPDIQRASASVPAQVARLVMQCLEKDPQRRPRTGRDVLESLGPQ